MSGADGKLDIEALLRQAMSPIEPPERLGSRVEGTLRTISDLAADELESWELAAMGDPRNWFRPAIAVAVGSAAGAGLAVLSWRQVHRQRRPAGGVLDRAAEEVAGAVRRGAARLNRR